MIITFILTFWYRRIRNKRIAIYVVWQIFADYSVFTGLFPMTLCVLFNEQNIYFLHKYKKMLYNPLSYRIAIDKNTFH